MNRSNASYRQWILNYLKEQGVDLSCYKAYKPLYLRYRARCLKLKPTTERSFRNLCTFESTRHTKYDDKGVLKEGETTTRKDYDKPKDYASAYYTAKRARDEYKKLNYKEPPKKEDFELDKDYRKARQDYNYIRDQLAEYESVKALDSTHWKKLLPPGEGSYFQRHRYMFRYPFMIRYALRCLSGEYPPECYPDALTEIKGELQELLDKQREVLQQEPVNFKFYM